jgi:hypothetical protein
MPTFDEALNLEHTISAVLDVGKGESDLLRFVDFWHTSTLNEVISFGVIPLLLGLPFTLAGFLILRSKKEDSPTHSL